ncbi:SDR family NAD(P)-dependent oxidoreductase [Streptomyces sp. WAC05458]|nr:SDR family NAD(P)-dependent oxidoreductase [Streptomyces sp. RT42]NUV95687.1 SDR family NAD(P)-dependent oxidoreductase [Streptomyces sp. KAI 90]RSS18183.1 SDR family NAD(P)-dependent oxidoreductase [Streptomyces sp. WAC05458]RSS97923.1 SDR family NAD(P)-dependent oxidoreductase [Streptomyces sp. WAC02707]
MVRRENRPTAPPHRADVGQLPRHPRAVCPWGAAGRGSGLRAKRVNGGSSGGHPPRTGCRQATPRSTVGVVRCEPERRYTSERRSRIGSAGEAAFVTGAASGIGLAVSRALVTTGAEVALADIDEERLDDDAKKPAGAGGTAMAVPLDVSDADSSAAAADRAEEALGPISILRSNPAAPTSRSEPASSTFARMKGILRDFRLKGNSAHYAMLSIARLHNLALTGERTLRTAGHLTRVHWEIISGTAL